MKAFLATSFERTASSNVPAKSLHACFGSEACAIGAGRLSHVVMVDY